MQTWNFGGNILKTVTLACLIIAIKLEEVVTITPDELQVREGRTACNIGSTAPHLSCMY